MEKGFSKIELLVTTALMMTVASGFMNHIQRTKEKILEEGAEIAVRYENMLDEIEGQEDVRNSIIRKLVNKSELSEEEWAYIRAKGLHEET